MLVSHKIGGLPFLSDIFDYGPIGAAVIMFIADFGVIYLLMIAEGFSKEGVMPWHRSHYKTFLWNDTVFIPLYMFMAAVLLRGEPAHSALYTEGWWHVSLLILGFAISLFLEFGAVKFGQYTMRQELSPSKLWHTFIFGIVFYWLASTIIPVLMAASKQKDLTSGILVAAAIIGFVYNTYRDSYLPFPKDAHLEGSWLKWDWHRRSYKQRG